MSVELTEGCPSWYLVCALCPAKALRSQSEYFKDWKKSCDNSLEGKGDGSGEEMGLQLVSSHSAKICILQQILV